MLASSLLFPIARAATAVEGVAQSDTLILEVHPAKHRIYLNERVALTVTLLTSRISIRNIQYPRLDIKAARVSEFSAASPKSVTRDGVEYTAYEFTATFIPQVMGNLELGPTELRCDQLAPGSGADAYYGGGEPRPVVVRSEPVSVMVLPFPPRNRPAGFSGAVGDFTLTLEAKPTQIRHGDPVTVTTRIEGIGNIEDIPCMKIAVPGVRAYPPRSQRKENRLTCIQVLLPETASDIEIPPASMSYLDPRDGRYRMLNSQPIRLRILDAPGKGQVAASGPAPVSRPGHGGHPPPTHFSWRAATAIVALLLAAGLGFLRLRRAKRRQRGNAESGPDTAHGQSGDIWLEHAERAYVASDWANFHAAAFRSLQAYLGKLYGLPARAITQEIISRAPQPAAMNQPLSNACARLFTLCDRARFAPFEAGATHKQETLGLLRDIACAIQGCRKN